MSEKFFEGVKKSLGKSLDSFQNFLEKVFSSADNKEAIDKLMRSIKESIGLKSKKELSELKDEVESGIAEMTGENTLVFGDSIAVGLSKVIDGLAGGKAKEGLRSSVILDNLKKFAGSMKAKNVPLISGFNDLVGVKDVNARKVKNAVDNLQEMVGEVKSKGGRPVLVKLYKPLSKRIDTRVIEAYNSKVEELSVKENVKLVDLSKADLSMAGDGLHLTGNGYESMWRFIRKEVG